MKTSSPPAPAGTLAPQLYFQLVHTLTDLLPTPLDDTPEGLRSRNLAAIAKVSAMLSVNANETDLAAQCVAARAQAEDVMRLIRKHAGDLAWVVRLNAQHTSMVRTSLSPYARQMRVQAARQKREAIAGAAGQDAIKPKAIEQCMLIVVDADAARQQAARGEAPGAVRGQATRAAPAESPRAPEAAAPVAPPMP